MLLGRRLLPRLAPDQLATFFRWTGVALVFIAAGLLSHAVHELIEIGVINIGTQTLFDISSILPHEGDGSIIGQLLAALFGYTSSPEVITFVVWLTYIVVVLTLFLRPVKSGPGAAGTGFGTDAGPHDQDRPRPARPGSEGQDRPEIRQGAVEAEQEDRPDERG